VVITPELIEQITRRVLDGLPGGEAPAASRALFLGNAKAAQPLAQCCDLTSEADYAAAPEIERYAFVVVGSLTNAQLADIATGRDDCPFTHAVISALLAGKPVYLLPEAPAYRRCGQSSPALIELLDGYVRQLERFGVQRKQLCEIGAQPQPEQPTTQQAALRPGLLTAAKATELAKHCDCELRLAPGTIITPLARDVFVQRKVRIIYSNGNK